MTNKKATTAGPVADDAAASDGTQSDELVTNEPPAHVEPVMPETTEPGSESGAATGGPADGDQVTAPEPVKLGSPEEAVLEPLQPEQAPHASTSPVKKTGRKRAAKKTTAMKAASTKTATKKPRAKKSSSAKVATKKTSLEKTETKTATSKKASASKATSKKIPGVKAPATTASDAVAAPAADSAANEASPASAPETPAPKKRRSYVRKRAAFEVAGHKVTAGKRMRMELPIGKLMSGTPIALPLLVVHGKQDGPVIWVSAAIHGDEICGVEIIRQVLEEVSATTMAGTIIAAPVVNVHGFNTNDRYLPDRRDLNRSFPGSIRGSLASRIAYLFMKEVVTRSDVGIDLHTGSDLRTNLPQIRCDIDHGPTREIADTFGAPIVIDARLRDGSLRQATVEAGKIMLLFEGGEASRFDPAAIAAGTAGVLRTLNHLGLIETDIPPAQPSLYSRSTSWSRAQNSGIVHLDATLGSRVTVNQQLATIYDPYGKTLSKIKSKYDGIVVGHSQAPLVNRGDAISHVARILPEAPSPAVATNGAVDTEDL